MTFTFASGHEAFSSLVDVAVQQPLLPVPHKDEKRSNVPVSESAQHHAEIRFHPHLGECFKFYIDRIQKLERENF